MFRIKFSCNQRANSTSIGDFNAKCSKRCGSHKSNIKDWLLNETDNIETTVGYSQVINKPTDSINGICTCIFNMSFIGNYGFEKSIFEKSHHTITYGSLDLYMLLPPPYNREIWDYKNAGTGSI